MKRLTIFFTVVGFVFLLDSAPRAEAVEPRIGVRAADHDTVVEDDFTFSTESTELGATTDVTMTFSLDFALDTDTELNFTSRSFTNCENWGSACALQLNLADSITSTIDATLENNEFENGANDSVRIRMNEDVAANTQITLTFYNVVNPTSERGIYVLMSYFDEGQEWNLLSANSELYGTPAIQGVVYDSNGETVRDVWVNAWPTREHSIEGRGSGTGPNGEYAIFGLTGDVEYGMNLWLPEEARNGNVTPSGEAVRYTGTTITKDFTLEVAVKKIIVDVLYDDTGEPAANVNIWANNEAGVGGVGENVDENGRAEFFVPRGAAYRINLGSTWNNETNRPNTVDWVYNDFGLPPRATFGNSNEAETASFTLRVTRTSARVVGRVLDADGDALTNTGIDIRNREGFGNWGSTNENGEFTIPLPAGSFTINIWRDDTSGDYFTPVSIQVEPNETLDVGTLQMNSKDSSISGRVVDENGVGVGGIRVNAWTVNRGGGGDNENNGNSGTTTDADGTFTITVFSGRRWAVSIDQGGDNTTYIQTDENRSDFEYDIEANESVTGVELHVKLSDVTIYARLIDENDELLTNVWGHVEAYDPSEPWGRERYWGQLNGGSAVIQASSGADDLEVMAYFPPETDLSVVAPVTISNVVSGETYNVSLSVITNDATIQGTIKDDEGDRITGVEAEVYAMDVDYPIWRGTRVDTETGNYSIDLLGGRQYMINSRLYDTTAYLNSDGGEGTVVSVRAGQTLTHDINVTNANATIRLTALNPNGERMEYVWFWCDNHQSLEVHGDFKGGRPIHIGQESNGRGEATLAATAGIWSCSAGADPSRMRDILPPDVVDLTVSDGNTASATLTFRRSDGVLSGSIERSDGGALRNGGVHAWSPNGPHSWAPIVDGEYELPLSNGTWFVGADVVDGTTFYRARETQLTFEGSGTFNLVLQPESFDVPESQSFTFQNTVQQHLVFQDGTELLIPAEALGSDGGNVTVTGSPTANLRHIEGDMPVAYGMDFDAMNANNESITEFASPVTLRIPYRGFQNELEEEGISEEQLALDFWDETKNAYESTNAVQNTENDYFETQVTHFTIFSVNSASGGTVTTAAVTGSAKNLVVTPLSKGGPQIAVWDVNGTLESTWFAYSPTIRIGVDTEVGDIDGDGFDDVISFPAHKDVVAHVRMFDRTGELLGQFYPYGPTFRGRIHVRMGDLNGDGTIEIVTYPHEGTEPLQIFDRNGRMISTPLVVGSGGGWLELDDVDNNGTTEMIVASPRPNGRVKIYEHDKTILKEFDTFWVTDRKGVASLSVADVDYDAQSEIIVSADGNGSNIRVYETDGRRVADFNAYAPSFMGGARVAVGNINGTPELELIALPNVNGAAHVRVFTNTGGLVSTFFAYPPATTRRGMFQSVVADLDSDGTAEIISGTGVDLGPQVRIFDARGNVKKQFIALHPGFRGGIVLNTIRQ